MPEYIELVPGWPPWHWGCAGTHYKGAGMVCMMDLWHWRYAGIHGTGARPASMALVQCQYTLQWCQNGLHDRPHGIGDGQNIWRRFQHSFHGIGVVLEHIPMVLGWPA
ncbi:hypothetical protein BKA82DRAFT_4020015 [Pisolithus tinctorius]|nr:hypothetical protein BKA82DRAFT_4020015 [Pisolithus tinctorius]